MSSLFSSSWSAFSTSSGISTSGLVTSGAVTGSPASLLLEICCECVFHEGRSSQEYRIY